MSAPESTVTNKAGPGYSSRVHSPNIAGRWYLMMIGLFLCFAGLLFGLLMWRSFRRAKDMDSWPAAGCVIFRSETERRTVDPSSPPDFRFKVQYGYRWQGKEYQSERWTLRGSPWSSGPDAPDELVAKYPAGSLSNCRVDPQHPETAVLKVDSKAPGYAIWFPALIVLGGCGIAVGAFRKRGLAVPKPAQNL